MISTSWNTNIHDIFPTKVHKSQLWSNALWELSWPYIDFLFSIYISGFNFFHFFEIYFQMKGREDSKKITKVNGFVAVVRFPQCSVEHLWAQEKGGNQHDHLFNIWVAGTRATMNSELLQALQRKFKISFQTVSFDSTWSKRKISSIFFSVS